MQDGKSFDPLLKQVYGENLKTLQKGGKNYFSKIRSKLKKAKKAKLDTIPKKD